MKEILKNLVENVTLPEDTYLDQDDEILEIFVEDLEEIYKQKKKKKKKKKRKNNLQKEMKWIGKLLRLMQL